eukprot:gene30203-35186_t
MVHGSYETLDNTAAFPEVVPHHHEGTDPKLSMYPCETLDNTAAAGLEVLPHHHEGTDPNLSLHPCEEWDNTAAAVPGVLPHHHEGTDPNLSLHPCEEWENTAAAVPEVLPRHHEGMEPKLSMLPVKSRQTTLSESVGASFPEVLPQFNEGLEPKPFDTNHTAGSAAALNEQSELQFRLQIELREGLERQKQQSIFALSKLQLSDPPSQNDGPHLQSHSDQAIPQQPPPQARVECPNQPMAEALSLKMAQV